MSMYVCTTCEEEGKDTRIPADEVGAALMQQHLESSHGLIALSLKTCGGCGTSVATKMGAPAPQSCEAHS